MGNTSSRTSKTRIWTGRILGTVSVLFFLMDAGMKLAKPSFVVAATVQLGYPESTIIGIGLTLLVCTILYVIPRTAVFGAILLTGYLGGAVASNVRAQAPFFNLVFPVVFATMAWVSLVLRNKRLEDVLFWAE
jgi:hypothetical protein